MLRRFFHYFYYLLVLSFYGFPCISHAHDATLKIGSRRFTESYILAELLAQTAASSGTKTQVLQGLDSTAIVLKALKSGQIDAYAEYSGTIVSEILKAKPGMALQPMQVALAKLGLGAAVPFGFNGGYALAMPVVDADRLGIRSLSDLAKHPELKLGLSNEFITRPSSWKGLSGKYQLSQTPISVEHELAYTAIEKKRIDVMDIRITDAMINRLKLRVLVDDQNYFPRNDALVLYRLDLPHKYPAAWAAIQKLKDHVSEPQMIEMNAQSERESQPFGQIAKQFLVGQSSKETNLAKPAESYMSKLWQRLGADDLWRLLMRHIALVLASAGAACLTAVLVVKLYRHRHRN